MKCYCDQDKNFADCCEPYLIGEEHAADAATLMRSRYSAYATQNKPYLEQTWHPNHAPKDLNIDPDQKWIGLKVLSHDTAGDNASVKFVARYKIHGKAHRLEEHSLFSCISGRWYYLHAI